MTDTARGPKVITITPRFRNGNFCGYDQLDGNTYDNSGQRYEFIEKSAYDKLQAELAEYKRLHDMDAVRVNRNDVEKLRIRIAELEAFAFDRSSLYAEEQLKVRDLECRLAECRKELRERRKEMDENFYKIPRLQRQIEKLKTQVRGFVIAKKRRNYKKQGE